MQIHTLSAYETTAKAFFDTLSAWKIELLLDVRLKNTNQLAGFTKRDDLAFFVPKLLNADYVHNTLFAPASTIFERYIHGNMDWDAYSDAYRDEMIERDAISQFYAHYSEYHTVCILGTATHKRRSHAEVLQVMLENASNS